MLKDSKHLALVPDAHKKTFRHYLDTFYVVQDIFKNTLKASSKKNMVKTVYVI